MNKEQQELLDEAYENYLQHYDNEYNEVQKKKQKNPLHWMEMEYTNIRPYPKEIFINRCKTDSEFSEKWGLQIEEKELSEEERWRIRFDYYPKNKQFPWDRMALPSHRFLDDFNIPRRVITITYNNKTIENYE